MHICNKLFKSTSFTNTKCKVSDIAFERLQLIKQ